MKYALAAIASGLLLSFSAQAGTGISSVTTSAAGTTWVDLPSLGKVAKIHFINDTGTSMDIRMGGGGTALTIPNQVFWSFNEINGSATGFSVRRSDSSTSQVTLKFTYESP